MNCNDKYKPPGDWYRTMFAIWDEAPMLLFMVTSGDYALAFGGRTFRNSHKPDNDNAAA